MIQAMTRRRNEVVREVGHGKYVARDATWARPEVARAFDRALKQELAENQRKREELQRERDAAA
jgi:hypothetical protein